MRPTMSDVAKAASVSTSTVSRALAGDARVKEETRRYIAEVAASLGYTPNRTAAALRQGKTWMIGVVTPGTPRAFSDPFYLEFLGGLGDRAMEAGYNLVIAAPSPPEGEPSLYTPEPRRGLDLAGLVAQGAVDAVALTEPAVDDPRLELLRGRRIPFAFLGMPEEGGAVPDDVPYVDGDNVGSSKVAVEHLIALGHRRIACVTGEAGLAATKQRLDGYLLAMREAGLPVLDEWVVSGDSTKSGGRRAMTRLLELGSSGDRAVPTAVFAGNDLMAVGALRAARDAGLRVPEDLSVVGFDGIPLAELVDPPLTTVKQPIYEFGRRLAAVLLAQLDGAGVASGLEGPIRREIVPGRLVVRGSTGPPPEPAGSGIGARESAGSAAGSDGRPASPPAAKGVVPGG